MRAPVDNIAALATEVLSGLSTSILPFSDSPGVLLKFILKR